LPSLAVHAEAKLAGGEKITGETTLGLVVLVACSIMAGIITFLMGHDSKIEMAGSRMMAWNESATGLVLTLAIRAERMIGMGFLAARLVVVIRAPLAIRSEAAQRTDTLRGACSPKPRGSGDLASGSRLAGMLPADAAGIDGPRASA
jgi:hypothetical protein